MTDQINYEGAKEIAIDFAKWKDKNGWHFEGVIFQKLVNSDGKPYEYLSENNLFDAYIKSKQ